MAGQFDVDVIIHNLNQATNCASFNLHYDPAAVDFVGLQGNALLGTDPNPIAIDNPGVVQVLMEQGPEDPCQLSGVSGTGLLARLRFTSLGPDVQSGFDAQPGISSWQGPPMCQTQVLGQDYSAASGVVVIGDATISCLNINVANDLDPSLLPAGNPRCNGALGNGDISLIDTNLDIAADGPCDMGGGRYRIQIADDDVATISNLILAGARAVVQMTSSDGTVCGVFQISPGSATLVDFGNIGANLDGSAVALTGTTGTNGKATVHLSAGRTLYIENRMGSTLTVDLQVL